MVWVAYAVLFFGTIARRKTAHIYVANWFYGGFILAVAVLHVLNSLAVPVTPDEVLFDLRGHRGRHGAVVVRTQRGGVLL